MGGLDDVLVDDDAWYEAVVLEEANSEVGDACEEVYGDVLGVSF